MNTGTESATAVPAAAERQRPAGGGSVPSRRPAASGGGPSQGTGGTSRDGAKPGQPGAGKQEHPRKKRPLALRVLLWILRKSIVPILCAAALAGGLYAGYVVLGKGPEDDVWQWSTWKHMWDLIFSE